MMNADLSATTFFAPRTEGQDIVMPTVLIVDDNPAMCLILEAVLVSNGYDVQTAAGGEAARKLLAAKAFDVVVTDIGMPAITGIDLLNDIQRMAPDTSVLLMTGLPSVETATKALQGGAFDYMVKPITAEDILRSVRRASGMKIIKTQKRQLEKENKAYRLRLEQTVERRTMALHASEARLEGILMVAPVGIYVSNGGLIQDVNPAFCDMLGYHRDELRFHDERMLHKSDDDCSGVRTALDRAIAEAGYARMTTTMKHRDGSIRHILVQAAPVDGEAVKDGPITMVAVDITDQLRLQAEQDQTKAALFQAQKMDAIGRLASGIAHEINTPSQFVISNLTFLRDAMINMRQLNEADRSLRSAPAVRDHPLALAAEAIAATINVVYLGEEIPKCTTQSLEGMERIRKIVVAMREFSHPGTNAKSLVDINRIVENTLTICNNEWRYIATVALDLGHDLPLVPCMPGEMGQVLLNLIVNASHAIADKKKPSDNSLGIISISTALVDHAMEIRITDTGHGIAPAIKDRIYEPFFTTKGIGKGTGQGLALAWSVVVDQHRGTLSCDSAVGIGTTFIIRLPMPLVPESAADVVASTPLAAGTKILTALP